MMPALSLLWAGLAAHAQVADHFAPSPSLFDGQPSLQVLHPWTGHKDSAYVGVALVASEHLIASELRRTAGAWTHLGWTPATGLRIDAALPTYLAIHPEGERLEDASGNAFRGAAGNPSLAPGDAHLGLSWTPLGPTKNGFALGIRPSLRLPTGSVDQQTSYGAVGGGLQVAAGASAGDAYGWNVAVGPETDIASLANGARGLRLDWGGSVWARATKLALVGWEVDGITPVARLATDPRPPWATHVFTTIGADGPRLATFALGAGMPPVNASPAWRAALSLSFRDGGQSTDIDGDGLANAVDTCPNYPEDADGYQDADGCPDPDDDQDGIADGQDLCRHAPEDYDGWEDADGCPEDDNDDDGLVDSQDQCPVDWGPLETGGCPDADRDGLGDARDQCPEDPGPLATMGCPDRDQDRVPDIRDECPDQPTDSLDPELSNGCPAQAVARSGRIEISDKVHFDFNRATIRPVSFPVLDEVAAVILADRGIRHVEVGGHTDSLGSEGYNQRLSQARAEAVRRYLLETHGIDDARLSAKGYGESRPLDSNDTDPGRYRNRRVEFLILAE